jgi:hypothetical protein
MQKYSQQEAKSQIEKLVQHYDANKSATETDETKLRRQFLDRFFSYLN